MPGHCPAPGKFTYMSERPLTVLRFCACIMAFSLPPNRRKNPHGAGNLANSVRKVVNQLRAEQFLDSSPRPSIDTLSNAVFGYGVRMEPQTYVDHPRASLVLSKYAMNGLRQDIANGLASVSSSVYPTLHPASS